jgi:hypothetical protein
MAISSSRSRSTIACNGVEQPGIAGFGGEQDQLADGDDAAVVLGGWALNVAHFIGPAENSCRR